MADQRAAEQKRLHFNLIVPSAYPVLIHPEVIRDMIVMINETSQALRVGHSGTVATLGMYLPQNVLFEDKYTMDEYWAIAISTSGSISGYVSL
jgi:hypothetical protein